MKVLVTGASGFVGRALCRAFADAGHGVHALTRDPGRLAIDGPLAVTAFEGSVGDPRSVARAAAGCDVMLHTAGLACPRCTERVARWVHVAGTENVLKAARHARCRRVVHFSCADVTLHDGDRLHWDEVRSLAGKPVGAHAQTKLVAEEIALSASDAQLEVTALRPAWLWGHGDFDGIGYLCRLSAGKGIPLPGGGRNLLAHTHIDNLARGALLAATAEAAPGRAYHITDGEFADAREHFTALSIALGLPPPRGGGHPRIALWQAGLRERLHIDGPWRAESLRVSRGALFDLSRATQDLSYEPHGDPAGAMQKLAEWVKRQGGIDAVVAKARPLPTDRDVDAQVALAGGD